MWPTTHLAAKCWGISNVITNCTLHPFPYSVQSKFRIKETVQEKTRDVVLLGYEECKNG